MEKAPDEVTLQLKWVHQAQFAGFYMAREKGYYEKENLKVRFLEGGNETDITTTILNGDADFGVVASEMVLIQRQLQSAPITAIAAIYRRSATVYVSKKGSNITQPTDLPGKKIAALTVGESVSEFEYQLMAMMHRLGLDQRTLSLVPYDPEYKDFIAGNVDVTPAYLTAGVIKLRRKGLDLNIIWPGDYNIHFYSDTLVTTEEMIEQRPNVVERFLRATLKGWKDALGNTEEAIQVTMKYAQIQDEQFQTDMLNSLRPLVDTGKDHIGWMSDKAWLQMHNILINQGILSKSFNTFENVYTTRFLDAVYIPGP